MMMGEANPWTTRIYFTEIIIFKRAVKEYSNHRP
jgi:hypothetical protein